MRDPIKLPFNKDQMTLQEAKIAAEALRGILRDFDNFSDEPEEFVTRVLQIRGQFSIG